MEIQTNCEDVNVIRESIYDLMAINTEIRELINYSHLEHHESNQEFNRMCCCLDVIGDNCLAMESFLNRAKNASDGEKYLDFYGILQVLFVQHDAVSDLGKSFGLFEISGSIRKDITLKNNIRNKRNRATGHPTDGGIKKIKKRLENVPFGFICRSSMTERGFDLHLRGYSPLLDLTIEHVDIFDCIRCQTEILRNYLMQIKNELVKKEKNFYSENFGEGLSKILSSTNFYVQKIAESLYGHDRNPIYHLELVEDNIKSFREKLQLLNIRSYEDFDLIFHAINSLKEYFSGSIEKTKESEFTAKIFVESLAVKLDKLESIGRDQDENIEKILAKDIKVNNKKNRKLKLKSKYLTMVRAILAKHVPHMTVWAYGSRVTGTSHDGSDLDLVIINPQDSSQPQKNLIELRSAFTDSNIPISVDVMDWANIPESFREQISKNYVVIMDAKTKN